MEYTQINADTIDGWVREGWEWGKPVSHEVCMRARMGEWSLLLTPTKPVPRAWYGELVGRRVLGLASGGGQQMPILSIAGAKCTLMDYSPEQLARDKAVAEREGLDIEIIRADMTKPFPFADNTFDLIFHPVSNCYIENVEHVWRECHRVLRPGGRLLAGLDNGLNFAYDEQGTEMCHVLPYNPLKDAALYEEGIRTDSGIQFSHTIDEQIAGQLHAGLTLLDVYGDYNNGGKLAQYHVETFWATLAQKPFV